MCESYYVSNYNFVRFPSQPNTNFITSMKERNGPYSGILRLKIKALDYLYFGSGVCRTENDKLISETLREQSALILPGASLKGSVRQICRAVSAACIPQHSERMEIRLTRAQRPVPECRYTRRRNPQTNRMETTLHACIVCDMFGMMSLASKVSFSDCKATDTRTEIIHMPAQFSPHPESDAYLTDDRRFHYGYKFYYTQCKPNNMRKVNPVEVVGKGVVFEGTVRFSHLHEEQLELLMYALGLGKHFGLKLGGYKNDGLGTVQTDAVQFLVNGNAEDAAAWAEKYHARKKKESKANSSDATFEQLLDLEWYAKYVKEWERHGKG